MTATKKRRNTEYELNAVAILRCKIAGIYAI